eukprot:CAMPEP_0171612896 /NCGR_PEP_ID=MMETSP0990-20121206/11461_1 /TAXON_ID=483369 /ORGANISM="non described non described, Strain CCMP2098" /LENGTH=87 /DNA_ID=CAMNT_0012176671 /DNA_START=246 /DNA_END=509 /DNA_ORIENTATION=-
MKVPNGISLGSGMFFARYAPLCMRCLEFPKDVFKWGNALTPSFLRGNLSGLYQSEFELNPSALYNNGIHSGVVFAVAHLGRVLGPQS